MTTANELLEQRAKSEVGADSANVAQQNSDKRVRLLRLLLLCNSEQFLKPSEYTRLLELLHQPAKSDAVILELRGKGVFEQLDARLEQYAGDLDSLLGLDRARKRLASPPSLDDRLPDSPVAPVDSKAAVAANSLQNDQASDLRVNHWPNLLWGLAALSLIVLLVLVVKAALSVQHPLWNSAKAPVRAVETQAKSRQSQSSGAETGFAATAKRPDGLWRQRVDDLAREEKWDETLKALQELAAFENMSERDRTDCRLRSAGALLALRDKSKADQALDELLELQCFDTSPQWPVLCALALLEATQQGRESASRTLRGLTETNSQSSMLPRVLDWAVARDGSSSTALPELERRLADLKADGYDHLFLSLASRQDTTSRKFEYHLNKAAAELDALANNDSERFEPDWLYDVVVVQLKQAVAGLRQEVKQ